MTGRRVGTPRRCRPSGLVVGALSLLGVASAAAAQERPALLVLEVPGSTEATAYGGAPWLFTDGPDLLFHTPALLEGTAGVSASLQRYGSEGLWLGLSGAGSGLGGGFAAGLRVMRYETPLDGSPEAGRESAAFAEGARDVSELVGSVGYARTILGVRAGASLSLSEVSLDEADDRAVSVDLGVARGFGPVLIGLTARHLGPDLEARAGEGPELPTRVAAGASWESFEVGPLDLLLTSQVERRRDGELIPAGGFELSYWPIQGYTFRFRAGARRTLEEERSPLTLGAAFTGDHITVEYAFRSFGDAGETHRFGIRWR